MHRQLDHTVILLMEIIKGQLNEQNVTMAGTKTNRLYLLKQVANISKWIREFDPQNINFVDLQLPTFMHEENKPRRNRIDELKVSFDDQRYKWDNARWNDNPSLADSNSLDSERGRNNMSMQIIQPIINSSSKVLDYNFPSQSHRRSNVSVESNFSVDFGSARPHVNPLYQSYNQNFPKFRDDGQPLFSNQTSRHVESAQISFHNQNRRMKSINVSLPNANGKNVLSP